MSEGAGSFSTGACLGVAALPPAYVRGCIVPNVTVRQGILQRTGSNPGSAALWGGRSDASALSVLGEDHAI